MWRKKAIMYALFLLASLMFLAIDHRGISIGDHLFRMVGLSPWSRSNNSGLHYTVVIGLVLLFISAKLVMDHFRIKYKKAGRTVIILCILFFFLFPIASRWALIVVNLNNSGLTALDYSNKDYKCGHKFSNQDELLVNCQMTLFNYGKNDESVEIRPLLKDFSSKEWAPLQLEFARVVVPSRSNLKYSFSFKSKSDHLHMSGFTTKGGVEFKVDGVERKVYWE